MNFGGPVIKDHWFFMGSYAIQDIHGRTLTNDEDATWLVSGYAKMNFQFGNTSGDLNLSHDAKKKWGRTVLSSAQQNNGSLYDQDGPGWVYYAAIQQVMGNLMLDAKMAYTDGGFILDPRGGTVNPATGHNEGADMLYIYSPSKYLNDLDQYSTNRNQIDLSLNGNYFAENILNADHEIRFGVDYVNADTTTQDLYPNQRTLFKLDENLGGYGEVWFINDYNFDVNFKRLSFYLSDTVNFGKLNVNLGVRYDRESGALNGGLQPKLTWYEPGSPHHNEPIFGDIMGDLNVPAAKAPVAWKTISPRLSLTYDLTGDGKNVIKLSVARYGSQSGNALASNLFPSRETDFYWFDKNADNVPNWDEVMNGYYYYMANNYGYYNYGGPMQFWTNTQFVDYAKGLRKTQYNDSYNTPLLDELTLSFEKALGDDIAINVTGFYKRRHNLVRSIGIMPRRLARDRGQLVPEGSSFPGGRHVRSALCPQGEARRHLFHELQQQRIRKVHGRRADLHQEAVQQVDGRRLLHLSGLEGPPERSRALQPEQLRLLPGRRGGSRDQRLRPVRHLHQLALDVQALRPLPAALGAEPLRCLPGSRRLRHPLQGPDLPRGFLRRLGLGEHVRGRQEIRRRPVEDLLDPQPRPGKESSRSPTIPTPPCSSTGTT